MDEMICRCARSQHASPSGDVSRRPLTFGPACWPTPSEPRTSWAREGARAVVALAALLAVAALAALVAA